MVICGSIEKKLQGWQSIDLLDEQMLISLLQKSREVDISSENREQFETALGNRKATFVQVEQTLLTLSTSSAGDSQ